MLLHEGLTHIHSQIKPRFHFGESFTLSLNYFMLQRAVVVFRQRYSNRNVVLLRTIFSRGLIHFCALLLHCSRTVSVEMAQNCNAQVHHNEGTCQCILVGQQWMSTKEKITTGFG